MVLRSGPAATALLPPSNCWNLPQLSDSSDTTANKTSFSHYPVIVNLTVSTFSAVHKNLNLIVSRNPGLTVRSGLPIQSKQDCSHVLSGGHCEGVVERRIFRIKETRFYFDLAPVSVQLGQSHSDRP